MDWNNDGQIGMDDLILTDIILNDDEEKRVVEIISLMEVVYLACYYLLFHQ